MVVLSSRWIVLAALFYPGTVLTHYDETACCNQALKDRAFIETFPPVKEYICGQSYNASIPPAPDLRIRYTYCTQHCSGIGLSDARLSSQWVALIVQFLLPSVIFSMTIPRQQKIEGGRFLDASIRANTSILANTRFRSLSKLFQLVIWVLVSIFPVVPVVVFDSILWVATIVTTAGPMMIGGLHEALLDSRLLGIIRDATPPHRSLTNDEKIELLVAAVSGNLMRDVGGSQTEEIPQSLSTAEDPEAPACKPRGPQAEILESILMAEGPPIQTRLLSLMSSQYSFGSAVGAPVLFYLGAFVYSTIDLADQGGSLDSALSVAFAVEWMIIVHVAIVSGCLLASNNPSTSAAIVGLAPEETLSRTKPWKVRLGFSRERGKIRQVPLFRQAYHTRYQPVSLWSRGSNKMDWIQNSGAYARNEWFRKSVQTSALDWTLWIFSSGFLLIVLPPAAGGILAYRTPPVGWGCRSLSLICYAGVQVVLTFIAVLKAAARVKKFQPSHPVRLASVSIFIILLALSFFFLIGTTLMQITGIFRNCFCYVNAQYWLHPDSGPGVPVSSDTHDQRTSGHYWVILSAVATGFMALIGYSGWCYQRKIRQDFVEQVKWLDSSIATINRNIGYRKSMEVNSKANSTTQASLSRQSTRNLTQTNTLSIPLRYLTVDESTFNNPIEMGFPYDA